MVNNQAAGGIELFYFDAGGGHRSAALALQAVLAERQPHVPVRLVNLQDLLQPIDPVYAVSRYQSQDVYNAMLKHGWTYGSLAMLRGMQQGIRLLGPLLEERLRLYWRDTRPDLVVSLIPNFNGVLFRALRAVHSLVPYVTVMTDLADCPPYFWQEQQDQFLICGSDLAVLQAQKQGYAADKIFRVSGMVLRPDFYQPEEKQPALTRRALGLDPYLPTAMIMFGGYGSSKARTIVERLTRAELPVQSIVLCGHNEKQRQKLADLPRCHAVGFTPHVPAYMRLADFFIGKPGPGSISEALHMGLPVIVERNSLTLPQERYNTDWVTENRLGLVVKSFTQIAPAVAQLIEGSTLTELRANAARLSNRAVFEIPDILLRIMTEVREDKLVPFPAARMRGSAMA